VHGTTADPRPLIGEPLSLDLLNTRWVEDSRPHDLLDSTAGLAIWLRSAGLDDCAEADQATLGALLETREALLALADAPSTKALSLEARNALNGVLDHGVLRYRLGPDGPGTLPEADEPAWLPAWLAATDYLKLLTDAPARIKRCAHPDCILHFHDATKNGTRRWCSMAACGNRAKAARHYERTKSQSGA
jgi:predicted RNA-binding Zn ribbon-like protein